MMLKHKLLLVFFVIPFTLFSQKVILWGNIPEYAGEKIVFLSYSDQITATEKILSNVYIDENGDFSCSFNTDETIYVFAELGIYQVFIFTEPGREYELLFPERKDKSMADKLNPYFEPINYHLGIVNSSEKELNYQLAFFNEVYSIFLNKGLYLTYTKLKEADARRKNNKVDTPINDKTYSKIVNNAPSSIYNNLKELDFSKETNKIDSIFSDVNIKFFDDFKKYKYASFMHLSYQEKAKSISNTYYLNNEVLYYNPSYMELFNQVYKDYFSYFGRTKEGEQIYSDIGKHQSIQLLKKTLGKDAVLTNDTLKELVILKCLHDEFYKDKFSRNSLLIVLDSLAFQTKVEDHQLIANNIRKKVTKLMIGYAPPAFELYDQDSVLVSLNTFKGKYVYLGFCTTISYACIKEFEMLRSLYERHKDKFEIVMVCLDESQGQMKRFVKKKDYPYRFLHYGNQSEIFKDYDIRAFPTYYFIDKMGKLSISPAPSPNENAEFIIFQKLRANGDI